MTDTGAIVIPNAASALGRALCQEICARGLAVTGLAPHPADLEAIAARAGALFTGLACDLADPPQLARAFQEIRRQSGGVDLLINSAVPHLRRDILSESADSFLGAVNVNLGAFVICTREALSDMVDRGRGRILHIIGPAAPFPGPATAAHAVSSEAIRAFSRAVMADLSDRFPQIVISDWIPPVPEERPGALLGEGQEQAARWGATLALSREPSLNGTTWVGNREVTPSRTFHQRLSSWIYGAPSSAPRTLESDA